MAFFNIGKRVKPLGFSYVPRYWDQEKEEREARINAAREAAGGNPEGMKTRISASFRHPRRAGLGGHATARRKSNVTLLIVLIVLLALTFLLVTEFLPLIERM